MDHGSDSDVDISLNNGDQDGVVPNSNIPQNDVMDHEIWDDILPSDVDDDFPDLNLRAANQVPNTTPSADQEQHDGNLISRCLVILLAYFWTFFRISDSAIEFLLCGLGKIFAIAATTSTLFASILSVFPRTLYALRKEVGLKTDAFTKYVVCPTCHSIYRFEDSYKIVGIVKISKKCSFVKFPNHRQRWRRKPCGTTLLSASIPIKCTATIASLMP